MDDPLQLIAQTTFSEKFRGYDPRQVDAFLDRVGATIEELTRALKLANQRADDAEALAERLRASGLGGGPAGEGKYPAP